jgi:hypothetical protein
MNNYADANPTLNYSKGAIYEPYGYDENLRSLDDTPSFDKYQSKKKNKKNKKRKSEGEDYYCGGNSSMALRGMQMENTKVSRLFFSDENIERIQKKIKSTVANKTNGQFSMDEDQDEMDLLVAMRALYLDHGKHLDDHIVRQVKILNQQLIDEIMPGILSNVQQYYGYQRDINRPLQPIARPLNVSGAGRKTLPSMTSVWGF